MAKGKNAFDCAIIGAGASGMMAAITAARRGRRVLLLEHADKAGKKLLATGNGKCNFTNAAMEERCFYGDPKLLSALGRFTKEDALSFFHEIGIPPRQERGYYYPNCKQASAVVDALKKELLRCSVQLFCGKRINGISEEKYGFLISAEEETYRAKSVIFATGLLASPKLGSDGSAFDFLKGFGHHFTRIVPALCGFYAKGVDFKRIAGVRCDAGIRFWIDGEATDEEVGELQLTDYGISGIPVFQLSRLASAALAEGKRVEASVRFLPDFTEDDILREFAFRIERNGGALDWFDLLDGLLHQKLIPELLKKTGCRLRDKVADLSQTRPLLRELSDCRLTVQKARGYEFSQVCAGGIDTAEVDTDTLMSALVPGLFFCGELLDVDAICGGYNLQWAWSSGFVAGEGAAAYCKTRESCDTEGIL